jgi:hypothetical protein
VLVACLFWQVACAQQEPAKQAPPPAVKGAKVTPGAPSNLSLEVVLSVKQPEFVSGGAIPVVVTLRNTTPTGGAFVHSPEADMPFIFTVEPEKGEKFELSRDLYQQQTMPNPPPPREQEMAPLRAGASIDYRVDLARIMTKPLQPGQYKISAIYPLRNAIYRSAPIAIRIVAARAGLLEVAPSGNRLSIGAVLAHTNGSDGAVLYQRESVSGNPGVGAYRPRRVLRHPVSVAISTDGEGATEPRWVAWIEDGKVSFLHVWGDAELFATEGTPLPEGARLVSPGWTFDDESVLFLAATKGDVALITIQNRERPQVKTIAVGGGIAQPSEVRAGFFKTQQEPPARRLLVVWPAGNRLMCSIVNPEGEATPARELAQRAEPLVAVDIEPVGRDAAPIIHAVFSAAGNQPAHLVRVRAGEETQTRALPSLPESAAGKADLRWTVLAGMAPAVAVQSGERDILAWTPGSQWQALHDSGASPVSHLRLVALEQPWAVWADASDGLHYRDLSR